MTYQNLIENKWQPKETFEAVVFNFSLFDEKLDTLITKCSNFTKPNGLLIIQTLHPLNLNPYQDGWVIEDFKTSPAQFTGVMKWYGRTLQSWIKLFNLCNLTLKEIVEPSYEEKPTSIIYILKANLKT